MHLANPFAPKHARIAQQLVQFIFQACRSFREAWKTSPSPASFKEVLSEARQYLPRSSASLIGKPQPSASDGKTVKRQFS
jgi:hypothetical protein